MPRWLHWEYSSGCIGKYIYMLISLYFNFLWSFAVILQVGTFKNNDLMKKFQSVPMEITWHPVQKTPKNLENSTFQITKKSFFIVHFPNILVNKVFATDQLFWNVIILIQTVTLSLGDPGCYVRWEEHSSEPSRRKSHHVLVPPLKITAVFTAPYWCSFVWNMTKT